MVRLRVNFNELTCSGDCPISGRDIRGAVKVEVFCLQHRYSFRVLFEERVITAFFIVSSKVLEGCYVFRDKSR